MELTLTHPTAGLAASEQDDGWAALIQQHNRRVVLFLLSRGLSRDSARELAQETWTRLIAQHRSGRLERIEMPGLALRQARFLLLDQARQGQREDVSADEATALPDTGADPERRLLSREQLRHARAALLQCSPRAQTVFRAVYENPGVPHGEVASRLGLSIQRVRQTLCEVRAAIRGALESSDD